MHQVGSVYKRLYKCAGQENIKKTLTNLEWVHHCNMESNFTEQKRPNEIKKVECSLSVKFT